jgi:hypothetical protein
MRKFYFSEASFFGGITEILKKAAAYFAKESL